MDQPTTIKAVQYHKDRDHYYAAMQRELDVIHTRNSWILVSEASVPCNQQVLPVKWVFTYKLSPNGPPKYKARLVVRGDLQRDALSPADLYAHTAAMASFRTLIAISAARGYQIHQLDAIQAFLQSTLNPGASHYIKQPPGLSQKPNHVYKLLRPLYGLRTSPRDWFNTCVSTLTQIGAIRIPEEPSLWLLQNCIVFFYVDDFLIAGLPAQIPPVKALITASFEMRDLGLASTFLGIQIDQSDSYIALNQAQYINKLHQEFQIPAPRKHPNTPIQIHPNSLQISNTGQALIDQIKRIQRIIGSLYYVANNTRPDIAKATHSLSTHATNPTTAHITAAEQILQYLHATPQYQLRYPRQAPLQLSAATDSLYADL